jgi:hypothetical protein
LFCIKAETPFYSEIINECNDKPNQLPGGDIDENEIRTIIKLVELEQCNCRTVIFHINACVPSLVDDVSCISTSPKTSQCMLDACNEYSEYVFRKKT